ncbi:hypothetical protein ACSLOD_27830, partial [Escherichia coli]
MEGSRATHQTVQHYYESINRGTRSQVSISPEALEPRVFQRHFTMNQDALKILAKELTGEQFKVLMLMLADLDYENFIQI